jgi:hypothetical protein
MVGAAVNVNIDESGRQKAAGQIHDRAPPGRRRPDVFNVTSRHADAAALHLGVGQDNGSIRKLHGSHAVVVRLASQDVEMGKLRNVFCLYASDRRYNRGFRHNWIWEAQCG